MPADPATAAWCAERNHPWSTYNPWLNRTWCRCGQHQEDGEHPIDLDAIHEMFHTCPPGTRRCSCYSDQERRDRDEHQREIRERHRTSA